MTAEFSLQDSQIGSFRNSWPKRPLSISNHWKTSLHEWMSLFVKFAACSSSSLLIPNAVSEDFSSCTSGRERLFWNQISASYSNTFWTKTRCWDRATCRYFAIMPLKGYIYSFLLESAFSARFGRRFKNPLVRHSNMMMSSGLFFLEAHIRAWQLIASGSSQIYC